MAQRQHQSVALYIFSTIEKVLVAWTILKMKKTHPIESKCDRYHTKIQKEKKKINNTSCKNSSICEVAKRKMKNSIGMISMQFKCWRTVIRHEQEINRMPILSMKSNIYSTFQRITTNGNQRPLEKSARSLTKTQQNETQIVKTTNRSRLKVATHADFLFNCKCFIVNFKAATY